MLEAMGAEWVPCVVVGNKSDIENARCVASVSQNQTQTDLKTTSHAILRRRSLQDGLGSRGKEICCLDQGALCRDVSD